MNNRLSNGSCGLALFALSLSSLTGCHKDPMDHTKLHSTAETHHEVFGSEVDPLRLNTGPVGGGYGYGGGGEIVERVYIDDTGHKVPKSYYIMYCDIYYRMNWIRQELKKGSVPPDFGRKLANVRRELKEGTAGIARDGNYRVADEAITYLETGWKHYQAAEALVAAGAQTSSAPWSVGALAMQQFIENGGFGFGAKLLANASLNAAPAGGTQSALDAASAGALDTGTTTGLSGRQERAIAVAIRYARDFHKSPRECAVSEWAMAVEKINKLRDQLWLMNKSNTHDSGSLVDVRPSTGTTATAPAGDFEQITNTYSKNGTDLPNTPAPVGDPFRLPPPTTSTPSGKPQHSSE